MFFLMIQRPEIVNYFNLACEYFYAIGSTGRKSALTQSISHSDTHGRVSICRENVAVELRAGLPDMRSSPVWEILYKSMAPKKVPCNHRMSLCHVTNMMCCCFLAMYIFYSCSRYSSQIRKHWTVFKLNGELLWCYFFRSTLKLQYTNLIGMNY